MRERHVDIPLDGIVLADVRTGGFLDLGRSAGVQVVTLIRHRY